MEPHPTEKALRSCLQGWSYQQTAKARVYVDRAFSLSRVDDIADSKLTSRVQACKYTDPPKNIDEGSRHYVRLEIFTEHEGGGGDAGARK
jgi:hypothetical protein